MRNRAKCNLCLDVLESFHTFDKVECSCGEISISGGMDHFECGYKNIENFIRIDDRDKEVIVREGGIEGVEEQLPIEFTLEMIRQCANEDKDRDPRRLVTSYDLYCLVEALYHVIRERK